MSTIDIIDEMSQNFIDYAYEVNGNRAFPSVYDGLKPGQRACLWVMYDRGFTSNKPHVKSAKVSGSVIADIWPHGDAAIYETFVRMSQPWINNIPEVDFHGSNGNIVIGPEAASSRYTETRLAKSTEEGMFNGIKKKNVPFILNFSEDQEWPEYLPCIYPRLMVNGSQGIGLAHSQYWTLWNLNELTEVIENYINTNKLDYSNLYPDFPTGGILINKEDIPNILATGKGKVILRAKAEIQGKNILITEIPYQVYVEPFIDSVVELIKKEQVTDIVDIYNKTDKNRLLIEIECRKNPERVLKQLYALTDLQKSYSVNQNALVSKTPKLLNLEEYLRIYIQHNLDCIKRETEFDLQKAKDRSTIVEGLIKAIAHIDDIIALIKSSKDSADAQTKLMSTFGFKAVQAKAIVDMKLGRLAKLEGVELEEEYKDLQSTIEKCTNILSDVKARLDIFLTRLKQFTKKYGWKRRTQITQINLKEEQTLEEINIEPQDCIVVITESNHIKRVPESEYTAQKRNGVGTKNSELIKCYIGTNTTDSVFILTNFGKIYKTSVNNIPEGKRTTKGEPIDMLFGFEPGETFQAIMGESNNYSDDEYIIFATRMGNIKKTKISEYMSIKSKKGTKALKLKDDDEVISINYVNDEPYMIVTKFGYSIKFETKDINPVGKIATGVRGIKLQAGDEVIAAFPIHKEDKYVGIFTKNGQGKLVEVKEFTEQGRGGKGITCTKNAIVVSAMTLTPEDDIIVNGISNTIRTKASELPVLSRTALGNNIIKNTTVISVSKI